MTGNLFGWKSQNLCARLIFLLVKSLFSSKTTVVFFFNQDANPKMLFATKSWSFLFWLLFHATRIWPVAISTKFHMKMFSCYTKSHFSETKSWNLQSNFQLTLFACKNYTSHPDHEFWSVRRKLMDERSKIPWMFFSLTYWNLFPREKPAKFCLSRPYLATVYIQKEIMRAFWDSFFALEK